MRKYLLIPLLLVSISLRAQLYYHNHGKPIEGHYASNEFFIGFDTNYSEEELIKSLPYGCKIISYNVDNIESLVSNFKKDYGVKAFATIKLENKLDNTMQNNLRALKGIRYIYPYFIPTKGEDIILTNLFRVKLNQLNDYPLLVETAQRLNCEIVGQDKFFPLWFTLSTTPSSLNALEATNSFYEMNKFNSTELSLLNYYKSTCTSDPLFNQQWGFNNTGQNGGMAGLDMNICDAWTISTGHDITVAVIDEGIDLSHPDLIDNINPYSYDAITGTSPSAMNTAHGTQCAGIIGASKNTIGVTGVAHNCSLMSTSVRFNGHDEEIASAIDNSVNMGADILSNSYAAGAAAVINQRLLESIENALLNGRNGLGCVMVFSSGNNNSSTGQPPGNSIEDIICVGGIDRCGNRSGRDDIIPNACDPWSFDPGSSFGAPLDVVAPGSGVITTDIHGTQGSNTSSSANGGDYISDFKGSSAACPHVAGLAALILSINPCLTQKQVGDIIQRSAQKISTFVFDNNNTNRTNGTWNEQAGHGLIDAFDALQLVKTNYIQNTTISDVKFIANPIGEIIVGNNVDITQSYNTGDVNVSSGGDLALKSSQRIKLKKGFHASAGCRFRAEVLPNFNNCNGWTSSKNLLQNEAVVSYNQVENKINTNQENNISVYPNPNRGTFVVTYQKQDNTQITSIKVFDLLGKVLYEETLPSYESINNHEIDLSAILSNGCYFINITEGNHFANTKFIYHDN